jgi:hypothetical protein
MSLRRDRSDRPKDVKIPVDMTLDSVDDLNDYRRGRMRDRVRKIKRKQKDGFLLTDEEQAILAFFGNLEEV